MRKPRVAAFSLLLLLVTTSLSLAACGGSSSSTTTPSPTHATTATSQSSSTPTKTAKTATPAAGSTSPTPKASASATVLTASNSSLGKMILVNAAGLTLYTYSNDTAGVSSCTGSCASNWPPLTLTAGSPTGGSGVTGTLATITRSDGTKQVTYNGKPLYTFQSDTSAGLAGGDGVNNFHAATP
jgi:predicted lipoprotein with Yx(FWY)xxD motif